MITPLANYPLWDPSKALRFGPSPQTQASPFGPPVLGRPQSTSSMAPNSVADASQSPSGDSLESKNQIQEFPSRLHQMISSSSSTIIKVEDEGSQIAGDASTEGPDGDVVAQITLPNPSTFHIPIDKLKDALGRKEGEDGSYWSHLLYQKLGEDGTPQNVKVHYCTSKYTTEHVCKKYFLGEEVLGFDLEWYPGPKSDSDVRRNVSLIQVASASHIGLFHVARFIKDDYVAPTFKQIMEDPTVSKVGVAIKADCTRLKKHLGIDTRGIFELSNLHKVVKHSKDGRHDQINKRLVTLASQVKEHLQLPLYKGDSVRSSDWSKPLSSKQITYSAADAYAGVQLYLNLEEQRQKLSPTPPRPHHVELGLPLQVAVEVDTSSSEGSNESETEYKPTKQQTPKVRKIRLMDVKAPSPARTKITNDRDGRVLAAERMLHEYRSNNPAVGTAPSALRAYFIWHTNKDLNPEAIAKLLRDPPLQTHTVSSYIMNAVVWDNLPYDKTRMMGELLAGLHPNVILSQSYSKLMKECGVPQPEGPILGAGAP